MDSVDENKLVEDAIRGMLEKLYPHSSYATAKETKAMNEPLNGSFDAFFLYTAISILENAFDEFALGDRFGFRISNRLTRFCNALSIVVLPKRISPT